MVETAVLEAETCEPLDATDVQENVRCSTSRRLDSEASPDEKPDQNAQHIAENLANDRIAPARARRRTPWRVHLHVIARELHPEFQSDTDNPFAGMAPERRIEEIKSFCAQLWARTCMESVTATREECAAAA